jgi:hypothetical protein
VNITKITAAAAAAAAIGAIAMPLAWADDAAGTSAALGQQAKLVNGNSIQGWTITDLKPSTDAIPYAAHGTLWEATATDEALQGGATPIVSNLNARAADGQNYRVLFGVATPQGVNPATLAQGQKTTGKVYFDVTGPNPQSVVYNDGGRDLLTWQGSSSAPAAAPAAGTHAAAPSAASAAAPAAAAAAAAPAANATTAVPAAAGGLGAAAAAAPTNAVAAGTPAPAVTPPADGSQANSVSAQNPAAVPAEGATPAGTPAGAEAPATAPAAGQAPEGTPAAANAPAAEGTAAATNATPGAAAAVSGPTPTAPAAASPAAPAQVPAADAQPAAVAGQGTAGQANTAPAANTGGAPVVAATPAS